MAGSVRRSRGGGVREAKRKENETRVLDAAAQVFAKSGFDGATINQIATRADMPAATVHYYFATKEILYRRVLYDIQDLWAEPLALFAVDAMPSEALRAYIRAKIMLARDYPIQSRVFANELLRGAPYLEGYLRINYNEKIQHVWDVFDTWMSRGLIDPIEPKGLMLTIWAATQTYADFEVQVRAVLRKDQLETTDYETAIEQLSRIVIKGIGARDVPARRA
jgi:TetR/AcrR family transcriptional regulator